MTQLPFLCLCATYTPSPLESICSLLPTKHWKFVFVHIHLAGFQWWSPKTWMWRVSWQYASLASMPFPPSTRPWCEIWQMCQLAPLLMPWHVQPFALCCSVLHICFSICSAARISEPMWVTNVSGRREQQLLQLCTLMQQCEFTFFFGHKKRHLLFF